MCPGLPYQGKTGKNVSSVGGSVPSKYFVPFFFCASSPRCVSKRGAEGCKNGIVCGGENFCLAMVVFLPLYKYCVLVGSLFGHVTRCDGQ